MRVMRPHCARAPLMAIGPIFFIMPRSGSVFCQRRRSTNVHTCYRHLTECNLTYPAFSSCLAQKLSPILCDLRHRFYKASGGSLNKARARHALLLLGCLHFATVLLIQIKRQELIQFRPLHMYKLMIRERGQSKWRFLRWRASFVKCLGHSQARTRVARGPGVVE
jgi:hypothetical protein